MISRPKGLTKYTNGSKEYWLARFTFNGKVNSKTFPYTPQGMDEAVKWIAEAKAVKALWEVTTPKPELKPDTNSVVREPMPYPTGLDMKNICSFKNGNYYYWQVRMHINTERHNKIFPQTKDGLAKAITYRNSLRRLR